MAPITATTHVCGCVTGVDSDGETVEVYEVGHGPDIDHDMTPATCRYCGQAATERILPAVGFGRIWVCGTVPAGSCRKGANR